MMIVALVLAILAVLLGIVSLMLVISGYKDYSRQLDEEWRAGYSCGWQNGMSDCEEIWTEVINSDVDDKASDELDH